MNRFIQAYHNFKNNDLERCKKNGNTVGLFFLIVNFLQGIMIIGESNFIFWLAILLSTSAISFVFGYLLAISISCVLYYFAELVSPRREKSYLPNEKKEE